MACVVRTLLRAGLTSGSIMSLSDVLAQLIGGAFRVERFELARTAKYFWLGLTADGPFWETAFRVMERVFGAVEGPAGSCNRLTDDEAGLALAANLPYFHDLHMLTAYTNRFSLEVQAAIEAAAPSGCEVRMRGGAFD